MVEIENRFESKKLKEAILNLHYNDTIDQNGGVFVGESDYGFAEIYRMYDDILVFLIPTYGGTPCFYKSYNLWNIDSLVKELKEMC